MKSGEFSLYVFGNAFVFLFQCPIYAFADANAVGLYAQLTDQFCFFDANAPPNESAFIGAENASVVDANGKIHLVEVLGVCFECLREDVG